MTNEGRVLLEPAYVLHRRPYRDTSLLVEAFSTGHGRIGLVARGAQRPRSPLQPVLHPFRRLLLSWSGRGDLGSLTGAEPDGRPVVLAGDALAAGFYINELLLRLLQRHDPHPELFETYAVAVTALGGGVDPWRLRLFERDLLQAIGYALLLDSDAAGEPIDPAARYDYRLEQGPLPAGADAPLPIRGATLLALDAGERPDAAGEHEAKRLMRAALRLYLGDKPLASRALLRKR